MSKRECFTPKWPRFTPGLYTFSPAVKKGKILALSGIGSTDPAGELLYPGDVVRQTKQVFENMKEILAAAGASFDDVIKTVDYITPEALPAPMTSWLGRSLLRVRRSSRPKRSCFEQFSVKRPAR